MPLNRTLSERIRARLFKGAGLPVKTSGLGLDNDSIARVWNAAGTGLLDEIGTDDYNRRLLGGQFIRPCVTPLVFTLATSASLTTQRFFIADQDYEIVGITQSHATANGATMTGYVSKEVSGQAPGAGSAVMSNTFNLNGTANTIQTATIAGRTNPQYFGAGEPAASLKRGEMLSFKFSTTVTSIAGMQLTVYAIPQSSINPAVFNMDVTGSILTQTVYLANHYLTITGVQAVWSATASGSGTVTVDLTNDTSTNAPGAGTTILAAAVNVNSTSTVNVPVTPALSATASVLNLSPGDRIGLKMSGTLTALAGLTVVVSFANGTQSTIINTPAGVVTAQYNLLSNTNLGVASSFFTADRNYEIADISFIWSVAATTYTVGVYVDTTTTAPGGGTLANTAVSAAGTANTVNVATLSVSRRVLTLPAGARLSIGFPTATTKGSLAGLVATVSLLPR